MNGKVLNAEWDNSDVVQVAEVAPYGTIWRGEAHGLFERLTIPKHSIVANSSLAVANSIKTQRSQK